MKKQTLTCEKAREIDLINMLKKNGHFPTKESEKEAWFLSPFRSETQASFKVSKKLNRWYDHGECVGGNTIDFVIKSQSCSITEALSYLSQDHCFSFHQQSASKTTEEKEYEIKKVKQLENKALLDYLKSRCIDIAIAKKYCQEVYYKIGDKTYFAIAFGNDSNGYETRNKYFKACLGHKAITTLNTNQSKIIAFEGFIDFLSYKTLFKGELKESYIIFNSVGLIKHSLDSLKPYDTVYTYLDNDTAGKKALQLLKGHYINVVDCSPFYKEHEDLNDYLIYKTKHSSTHLA